jgi:hypothetical protein
VHSFSSGRQMFIAKDYLVVEVALYPATGEGLLVQAGHLSLHVNGRKQALSPQAPEFVADSLKHPDSPTGLHTAAQLGPVILGVPRPEERLLIDRPYAEFRIMPSPAGGFRSRRDSCERWTRPDLIFSA